MFGFGGSSSTGRARQLPLAERNARWEWLKRETGLEFNELMEPSHELCDRANEMAVTNVLSYIPWEKLTKRSDELRGVWEGGGLVHWVAAAFSAVAARRFAIPSDTPRRLADGNLYQCGTW